MKLEVTRGIESGVTYGLSEIDIEPIARLRDEKLEKLGL